MRLHRLFRAAVAVFSLAACHAEESGPWDGRFAAPVARPEHPRPDLRRDTFINLNTSWDFAYDPRDEGLAAEWYRRGDVWTHRIQVPYAWEAPLSGLVAPHEGPYSLADTLKASTYRGVAWYRLVLPGALPRVAGEAWHVVFGAVDYRATVWINGREALTHEGGYDPFSVNLADFAAAGERVTIVLRVEDETEANDRIQPVGKQGGVWYTRTSGIWQTVYLERRPATYVAGVQLLPEPDQARLRIRLRLNRPATGSLEAAAALPVSGAAPAPAGTLTAAFAATDAVEAVLPLTDVRRWDTATPTLYDLDLRLTADGERADTLHTYFGLVTVATGWLPGRGPGAPLADQAKALFVNGRPRYLRCVLDQSYYPDGVYTAPSLDAIRADLTTARDFGFNCIRLHIKSDEPVKYRLLDEMGFYVVYDIVALDILAENTPGFPGRAAFANNLAATMTRDRSHPSIVAWVVFNENWGLIANGSLAAPALLADSPDLQAWVRAMVARARALDPSRPVEDNSAGGVVKVYEHLTGDLNSFHYYGADAGAFRDVLAAEASGTYPGSTRNYVGGAAQTGAPWWNSEFASFSTLGDGDASIYCDLFGLVNEMRRVPKLTGWVLTELTDVEFEHNGLVNYDRSPKPDLCARDGVALADVFGDDHVAFDWLPGEPVTAAASAPVPLRFSQWSGGAARRLTLRLAWRDGAATTTTTTFTSAPYESVPVTVTLAAPAKAGAHVLVAEVLDGGARVAANRLTVEVR